jgi:glucokinase
MVNTKNNKLLTLGVDLGGTKVETALVDTEGRIVSSHRHPTHPKKGADNIVEDIAICAEQCLNKGKVEAQALGRWIRQALSALHPISAGVIFL